MSIKTNVIQTLVDKKKFTRQDIYKAIYKAQGKEIPSKFPNGFYGTNINHWERDKLIKNISRGKYEIGSRAKLYVENPVEYRKVMKEEREERAIKRRIANQQEIERMKENEPPHIKHSREFKHLINKTIKQVRYLTPYECAKFGWNKSSLAMFLSDGTIMIPQCDDEGNDGGAMMLLDKDKNYDVIYTI